MPVIDERSAIDVVREIYDTHSERDTPRFEDLLADDVVWHTSESHPLRGEGPWVGAPAVVEQVVDPLNHDWEGYITHVDELIDAGDRVVSVGRYRGTYKPTGRYLDAEVCTIFTVSGGRIVAFQQFTDTAQFRWAMGVDGPDPAWGA